MPETHSCSVLLQPALADSLACIADTAQTGHAMCCEEKSGAAAVCARQVVISTLWADVSRCVGQLRLGVVHVVCIWLQATRAGLR